MKAQRYNFNKTIFFTEMLFSGVMLLYFGWLAMLTFNTILAWGNGANHFSYNLRKVEFNGLISFSKLTYFLFTLSVVAIIAFLSGFTRFENAFLKVLRRSFLVIGFLLLLFRIHLIYDLKAFSY